MAAAIAARSNFGNVGPPTSLTLTFGGGVSSANSIIVAVVVLNRNADPTSVTDNGTGNTYTLDYSAVGPGAGTTDWFYVYRCDNPAGSPTTVTVAHGTRAMVGMAYNVSGLQAAGIDVHLAATEAATTTPSLPFTTTGADEFAVSVLSTDNGGVGNKTFTPGSSGLVWTLDSTTPFQLNFQSVAPTGAAGAKVSDGTLSGTDGLWDEWVVTYKSVASSSGSRLMWIRA